MDARTDQMQRSIEEQIAELRAQLETLIDTGAGTARDLADRARHSGAALAHTAQEELENGIDRAAAEVRAHPMMSVAIAAGIGWLIGRLAR